MGGPLEILKLMRFWLITLDDENRPRKLFEGAIAPTLRAQPEPIGSFQDDEIRYWRRRVDEPSVPFLIDAPQTLLGLSGPLATEIVFFLRDEGARRLR